MAERLTAEPARILTIKRVDALRKPVAAMHAFEVTMLIDSHEQLRADLAAKTAQVETLTQERDAALDQLRIIVKELPAPPWMERDGGSEWEPWCQWLSQQAADLAAAIAREQALREALAKALIALECGRDDEPFPSHRCSRCDNTVDRNAVARKAGLAALQPPDARQTDDRIGGAGERSSRPSTPDQHSD